MIELPPSHYRIAEDFIADGIYDKALVHAVLDLGVSLEHIGGALRDIEEQLARIQGDRASALSGLTRPVAP